MKLIIEIDLHMAHETLIALNDRLYELQKDKKNPNPSVREIGERQRKRVQECIDVIAAATNKAIQV